MAKKAPKNPHNTGNGKPPAGNGSVGTNGSTGKGKAKAAAGKPKPKPRSSSKRRKTVRGSATNHDKPWEPNAEQLEMYRLYCTGIVSQIEIAERAGVHQSVISLTLKKIAKWHVQQRISEIRSLKAFHEHRLMHLYREALLAFERSKKNAVTVADTDSDKQGASRTTTKKDQYGDPRYLAEARAALLQIEKIWGAHEPLEVRHSGDVRVAGMSREDAARSRIEQINSMLEPSNN